MTGIEDTEQPLTQAVRKYIEARFDPTAPIDDMTDEAIGAMNEALEKGYGFKMEGNQ